MLGAIEAMDGPAGTPRPWHHLEAPEGTIDGTIGSGRGPSWIVRNISAPKSPLALPNPIEGLCCIVPKVHRTGLLRVDALDYYGTGPLGMRITGLLRCVHVNGIKSARRVQKRGLFHVKQAPLKKCDDT